jgi:hypothetical protein
MRRPKARRRQSAWKWYAVRSLYRITAVGEPRGTDDSYDPHSALLEERVVLIQARSGREALKKAKEEGQEYARSFNFKNIYEQRVCARMLRTFDAFELWSPPEPRAEVFSVTGDIDAAETDDRILSRAIGLLPAPTKEVPWHRFKFISRDVVQLLLAREKEISPQAGRGNNYGG